MTNTPKTLYRGPVVASDALGVNWTSRTMPSTSVIYSGVAYGNSIYVAVGKGTTATATSPDGVTWTAGALPSSQQWSAVAYGGGVFNVISTNSSTASATSSNGTTWTARTSLGSAQNWSGLAYGNSLFVATSTNTSTTGAYSSDGGVTWTTFPLPVAGNWLSVVYGNSTWVSVSANSSVAATSPPAATAWSQRAMPVSANWVAVAYGAGLFVALSKTLSNGAIITATSPDGITWTQRSMPALATGNPSPNALTYANGLFVAVGYGDNSAAACATSLDGINWVQRTGLDVAKNWNAVTYGVSSTFVAVGDGVGATGPMQASTAFYTTPALTNTALTALTVSNPNSSAATVTLSLDGVPYLSGYTVAANSFFEIEPRHVLPAGKALTGYVNSTSVNVHASGVEIS